MNTNERNRNNRMTPRQTRVSTDPDSQMPISVLEGEFKINPDVWSGKSTIRSNESSPIRTKPLI